MKPNKQDLNISKLVFVVSVALFIFFLSRKSFAQITVKGTVQDSLGNPLVNVNVYATGPDSTSIKAYDYTNQKGQFSLSLKLGLSYLLHVSSLGYHKKIINIPAFSSPDTLVKTITLQPRAVELKELIVEAKRRQAIIVKKDTVIFNVSAFEQGNEDNVEDILEKLPGITVKPNGKVSFNGKTITKVLIGGEDLFGFNYQLLTKNLTADAIETVSVYKNFHPNPVLKGVKPSHQTVINLALKESFKVDIFGTITGYYDMDDHYRAKGNAISISKKLKVYLFENANNVGFNPTGNIYNLLRTNINQLFSARPALGANASTPALITTSPQFISHLDKQRYLRNQASFHSLGAIYTPIEKLKIKGVGYYLPTTRQINRRSITLYNSEIELPKLTEAHQSDKNIDIGFSKLTALYTFSNKMNMKYEIQYSSFSEENQIYQSFRGSPLRNHLYNYTHILNQNFKFTRRIAEKQAYQIRLRFKNEFNRQRFKVNPVLKGGPFASDTSSALVQRGNSHLSYAGADFTYWEKGKSHSWSLRAGGERIASGLHNHIPKELSFTSRGYWNRYRAFTALTFRKGFSNALKAYVKLTGNVVKNYTDLQVAMDDYLFYVSPEIGFNFGFLEKQHLQGSFALNNDMPDFSTFFKGRWLSSYRTIFQGADQFDLLPSTTLTLLYQLGNWEDNFVMNLSFIYKNSNKKYALESQITPIYNFSTYRLTDGMEFLNTGIEINQFLPFLSSNLSFQYHFTKLSYISYFNNSANELRSFSHNFKAFLRTVLMGNFNIVIGAAYIFSKNKSRTNQSKRNRQYISAFATLNINLGNAFNTSITNDYTIIQNAGYYNFLDVKLEYKLIEDKLTLYINGLNLFDENTFQTIYLGDYAKYKQRSVLNHRYVLFGAKFRF